MSPSFPQRISIREFLEYADSKTEFDNYHDKAFHLSQMVLNHYLGFNWLEKSIFPNVQKDAFLKYNIKNVQSWQKYLFRVIDLGELILNLQDVPNFFTQVELLASGQIESTVTNMAAARYLRLGRVPFRFIETQQRTGFDYDLEAILQNGVKLCIEAKCKLEKTEFTENTVSRSLKKAHTQLPLNEPGMIFLSVPQKWFNSSSVNQQLEDIVVDFLESNLRIVSVNLYVDNFLFSEDILKNRILALKDIPNPQSRFAYLYPENLINPNTVNSNHNWINLFKISKKL